MNRLKIVIDSEMLSKYKNKQRRKVNEDLLLWTPYTVAMPEAEPEQEVMSLTSVKVF